MTEGALDIEQPGALVTYLRERGWMESGESGHATVLAGGVSNRTVRVERRNGPAIVVKQALERLRVEAEWHCDPARIHREALGMRLLAQLAPRGTIPKFLFEDLRFHLLGMEAAPQPHENWKTMLLRGDVRMEHARQFGELLGTIHLRGSALPADSRFLLSDRGFFETLRIAPYYRHAATQVTQAEGFIDRLIAEMESNAVTVVHGDYSPKNILVHEGTLILLDHEVIHFGDPAFDLGFSLTHLLSKAHFLEASREALLRAAVEYWRSYTEAAGNFLRSGKIESRAVRHTLSCMLARVDGKSPLEYLTPSHRDRQRRVVLELMQRTPASIPQLIDVVAERWAA